jgi:hypothetical protein
MLRHPAISLNLRISAFSKKGVDQAEQICTLCVHMFSCYHSSVQQLGAGLASGSSTNQRRDFFLKTDRGGVCQNL